LPPNCAPIPSCCQQPVAGEDRGRRLEQEGLVGRAAALGDEQELVGLVPLRIDLDLRRQVRARVDLLEHRQRRELRIAEVLLEVGVPHALGDGGLVLAVGEDEAALLAHHDRRPGVLAHGQHAARGDVGVLQKVVGHELVVRGRLGVVEDGGELLQVARAQQVVDVDEGLLGELPDRAALDGHHLAGADALDAHPVAGQLAIRRRVGPEREQLVLARHRGG
jgi:hypothetical protein